MNRRRSASRPSRALVVTTVLVGVLAVGMSLTWAYAASSRSSAAAPDRPSRSLATGNRMLLVGDSLLWGSNPQTTAALAADGWDPTIAAWPGTTIGTWTGRMADLVARGRPDVVVVELGTNNCTHACPRLAATIDRLMRHVPRATPVYWLNVQAQPSYPAHPESVNDALAAARTRWPNITLVDMSARFRNHPEWHIADGLHFSTAGAEQLGQLIAQSLRASR